MLVKCNKTNTCKINFCIHRKHHEWSEQRGCYLCTCEGTGVTAVCKPVRKNKEVLNEVPKSQL